jgi:carbamoyltransferase
LHAVLSEYHRITGIPMVINTSFNMHEDPIVCSPEDAIDAVARGAADVLVLGSLWVECGDVIKVMVPRDAAT